MSKIDIGELRKALRSYATGIAVVTTVDITGKPAGMTINSFASVSLSPPLVLWSIDRKSDLFETFAQASHYAIHILRQDQEDVSNNFATDKNDKFTRQAYEAGLSNLPLLPDYITRFQCAIEHRYDGGDHIILIGRILDMQHKPAEPLLFHDGQYKTVS
ncbi:MAG: nitrilotriacetate monooxygenase [Alphaproteobacteria bacterium]|nr:MAG: nitrilotriacetate monooxygenase [Alphaproteobacteria bacterium]